MTGKEYRRELAKLRATQVTLLKALQGQCAAALAKLQAGDASWSDVNGTIRLLNNALNQGETSRAAPVPQPAADPLAHLRIVRSQERKQG